MLLRCEKNIVNTHLINEECGCLLFRLISSAFLRFWHQWDSFQGKIERFLRCLAEFQTFPWRISPRKAGLISVKKANNFCSSHKNGWKSILPHKIFESKNVEKTHLTNPWSAHFSRHCTTCLVVSLFHAFFRQFQDKNFSIFPVNLSALRQSKRDFHKKNFFS